MAASTHTTKDERARYGAYALARRAGEAATVRIALSQALDGHGDQHRVILTGDLNDTVQAATTQLLQGPPGSEIGTGGFNRPDHGDAMRMWNLAPLMPAGQDYSRINQGRQELIDHILPRKAWSHPSAPSPLGLSPPHRPPRSIRPTRLPAATPPAPTTPQS